MDRLGQEEDPQTFGPRLCDSGLRAGQVAQVIATPSPCRRRSEAVTVCIRTYEVNADRTRCDLYRKRRLPFGSGIVESASKHIFGNRFKNARAAGRKQVPTPCSPSDAAWKPCAGTTSSIGGFAASQPLDQKR